MFTKEVEEEIINEMVVRIEEELGMKCKVVPQSYEWYEGFCLMTSAIFLQMSLGFFKGYMELVKEKINLNSPTKPTINPSITVINDGINRNIDRIRGNWYVIKDDFSSISISYFRQDVI